jgi:hypothetical protein
MPVILATQEAEVGRITVWGHPWVKSLRDPISKNPQKRAGGVAQGVGHEFKHQYCQKIFINTFYK